MWAEIKEKDLISYVRWAGRTAPTYSQSTVRFASLFSQQAICNVHNTLMKYASVVSAPPVSPVSLSSPFHSQPSRKVDRRSHAGKCQQRQVGMWWWNQEYLTTLMFAFSIFVLIYGYREMQTLCANWKICQVFFNLIF